jgi:diguanylate cyclase (GGDEF)-like protein
MRKFIAVLAYASFIIIIAATIALLFFRFTPTYPIITMDKGWTVTFHNQQYLNTNLESMSKQVGTTFSRGDMISLYHAQPLKDLGAPFPYLFFKTQFCAYEVFLDDTLIESNYMDQVPINGFVGIGYNFVPLTDDYSGKRITIKLYVTENNSRADIISPLIGNFDDLYRDLVNQAMLPFITGCFLIMFGTVFLVISLIFYIRTSGVTTQILSSLLTITLGGWILTAFNLIDFIIPAPEATTLEFCFIYMLTPLIYLVVYDLHKRLNNRVLLIMFFATTFFSVLFFILHFTGAVHINHFQFPYYFISAFGVMILFYYDYMDLKSKSRNSSLNIIMLGLTVLSLSLVFYAGAAVVRRFVDYRQNLLLGIMIPAGAMFFVVTQLLNYFIFMTHTFAQKQEYAALTKIAYIDNLTSLPNRVSCDEKLAQLDKSDENFCLVSLDLNGLKVVNDNSGHPAGDRLLRSFAETLSDVFDETGTCCRIGGDEFVVLISSIDKNILDDLLTDLDHRLKKLDEEDQEINHSVSYGYAFRSETKEKDTHTVFMLADERMYNYKRQHYADMMVR